MQRTGATQTLKLLIRNTCAAFEAILKKGLFPFNATTFTGKNMWPTAAAASEVVGLEESETRSKQRPQQQHVVQAGCRRCRFPQAAGNRDETGSSSSGRLVLHTVMVAAAVAVKNRNCVVATAA